MTMPLRFERFSRTVHIEGTLHPETPLHVGAGRSLDVLDPDSPIVKDPFHRPVIPGSSFRGVLRSTAEMLLRGASPEGERLACLGVQDMDLLCCKDVAEEEEIKARGNTDPVLFRRLLDACCFACRVFGNVHMASKVRVADLILAEPDSWSGEYLRNRDGIRIDRRTGTVATGGKFDYEIVAPVPTFAFSIALDNPTEGELGLMLAAFDALNLGVAGLGGKRAAGLGRVRLIWSVREMTAEALLRGDAEGALLDEERLRACRNSLAAELKGFSSCGPAS
jgi:CRISPR-associated RAMP protein (TIGR02581 family)